MSYSTPARDVSEKVTLGVGVFFFWFRIVIVKDGAPGGVDIDRSLTQGLYRHSPLILTGH